MPSGEVAHGHRRRALAGVAADDVAGIALQRASVAQHVGEAHVAVGFGELRFEDVLRDREGASREAAVQVQDPTDASISVITSHEGVGTDGARVDHGVSGFSGLGIEGNLVEGVAGGLDVDVIENMIEPVIRNGERM